MKAQKRAQLIQDALAAGRADHPMMYKTIDLVTGLDDFPNMISIPYEPWHWEASGHIKIDLPAMGYRLVKAERR